MAKSDDELSLAKQRIEDLSAINSELQNRINRNKSRDKATAVDLALSYAGSVPQAVPNKDELIATARVIEAYLSE